MEEDSLRYILFGTSERKALSSVEYASVVSQEVLCKIKVKKNAVPST